nr:hypothetical protein Iba_chr13aCG3470 [Ipomoea batatas]
MYLFCITKTLLLISSSIPMPPQSLIFPPQNLLDSTEFGSKTEDPPQIPKSAFNKRRAKKMRVKSEMGFKNENSGKRRSVTVVSGPKETT